MRQVYSLIALAMVMVGCAASSGGSGRSETTSATSSSTGAPVTTLCRAETPHLSFTLRMVDCENHWVALPKKSGDDAYGYGYVYLDPEQGFTLHVGGRFTIDAHEQYHKVSDLLADEKKRLIIRLNTQGVGGPPQIMGGGEFVTVLERPGSRASFPPVAPLSKAALTQLGLPERPEWMKFYEDKSDAVTRKVHRGRAYNLIGDSERALAYLEPTYKEKPQAQWLAFELAYAYNALKRFDQTITVLTSEVERNPKDPHLCRELAFSYLQTKKFKEAVAQYPSCIALSEGGDLALKSEMAFNLARAYGQLGDKENCQQWISKAKEWAPQGSPLYGLFKQQPASIQPCAL